jgi:hypothetical protein
MPLTETCSVWCLIVFSFAIIGFDPLGLKPDNAKEFEDIQAKELSNGRLAMLAAIGMMVQELVNGQPVLADLP